MKTLIRFILIFAIFETYMACSQVNFSVDPGLCGDTENCITPNGMLKFDDTYFIGGGKLDILIVNDNSASMSFEQNRLAQRFNLFIEKLENRYVDYRLAITTTDISDKIENGTPNNPPRDINLNGALQDGKLVTFTNGKNFLEHVSWDLKGTTRDAEVTKQVSLFKETLTSKQTLQCEQFIANWVKTHLTKSGYSIGSAEYGQEYVKNCPSGDERGLYAARSVLDKNPNAFIRPDSHLVIIFLSDENVRSDNLKSDVDRSYGSLDFVDLSDGLIDIFNTKFGNSGKDFKVHSIVVKDDVCMTTQNNQMLGHPAVTETKGLVRGSIGHEYLLAAQKTGGVSGDICASDYTSQLTQMEAQTHNLQIILKCDQAKEVAVHQLDTQGNIVKDLEFTIVGSELKLKDTLAAGTEISVSQTCDPSLIHR